MTSITQNLPWFIKDLGVAIVGQKCYVSLVENLQFGDVECLKYSLSKGLGIGIVAGGSIMKVPQLMLILKAQSARGLSLEAYILETLSYAITLAYAARNNFPFSTYGENFFLTLQNVAITLLIIAYAPRRLTSSAGGKLAAALISAVAATVVLAILPKDILAMLQMGTVPLSVASKLPQIRQNSRAQSTGQLSAFAVISQIAGCLARLFTTATEVGDSIIAAGFAMALLLNCVLGAQMWMYWGRDENKSELGANKKVDVPSIAEKENAAYTAAYSLSPADTVQRLSTPPPGSPSGGRKWARKVD
ncbi:hypothetical protein HGRIS_006303 [Hohenbuehelia grisea]|uniref:Mannose-P-dolichol utilization defect 1 protein homolog n=1 Tax=Hohenbuehelia grisea TaxID=104357 RepID=A0ABR3JZS1_9AGAR